MPREALLKKVEKITIASNCGNVTPWMVPPQKRSPRTVRSRIIGPPGPNIAAIPGPPPAADGPTLGIVFSKSFKPEKWTRKDEAVSAVLGWVSRRAKHWHLVHPCMFEAMDSSGSGTVPFTTHAVPLGR